jgi:hypothetical protein
MVSCEGTNKLPICKVLQEVDAWEPTATIVEDLTEAPRARHYRVR